MVSDVERLLYQVVKRDNSPRSIHCTRRKSFQDGNEKEILTAEVWEAPPLCSRLEIVDRQTIGDLNISDFSRGMGGIADFREGVSVVVQGMSKIWIYSKDSDKYQVMDIDPHEVDRSLVTYPSLLNFDLIENSSITCVGKEEVSNRSTHRISIVPQNSASPLLQIYDDISIWIDSEHNWPIKTIQNYRMNKKTLCETSELNAISFNEDIPKEKFTFAPPEDAERITRDNP
ncbi:LolA family protein [Haloferax volcanii]|uniref:LolA family protein n=1 Tax=Haloferax volcanii TaxID=2246 RepID=UPI00349F33DA